MTPFRCELTGCLVTFKTSTHRKTHIATIHGMNKQNGKFSCTKCTAPNWYLGESQLKRHINVYHQDSPPPIVSAVPSSGWRMKDKSDDSMSSTDSPTINPQPIVSDDKS